MKIKKIIFLIVLSLIISKNTLLANINSSILIKINDQIITNIDLENEKKFLLFLNPNLKNLSENQILNISLDSLKNRKIKQIELKKYIDLDENNKEEIYISNFISNSKFNDLESLKNELIMSNIDYNYFVDNFKIDNIWREFVFKKFSPQIKINIEELSKQAQNQQKEIEELNLSEIFFEAKNDEELEKLKKEIYLEIDKSNFEAAAGIFSISDSKRYGGKLGWIKSNQISKSIYSSIKNIDGVSQPIKTNNGYLILKINEKRIFKEELNLEEELKKLIRIETETQLNKLGYIYFNKLKKKVFISEN